MRLAGADARFSFRQVYNGLTTGWGGTARLVALIGQSRAMELLLTGRVFDAAEARSMGLIHRLASPGETALDAAYAWADDLSHLPRGALSATKTLVYAAAQNCAPTLPCLRRGMSVWISGLADQKLRFDLG